MLSNLPRSSRLTTTPLRCQRIQCRAVQDDAKAVLSRDDAKAVLSRVFAAATAASVALSSFFGAQAPSAAASVPLALAEQQYEQQVQRLHHKHPLSNLPSSDEATALQQLLDQDMFTPEAWEGMVRLQQYAHYVEQLSADGVEEGPGCESCTANRMMLEKVWQIRSCSAADSATCQGIVARHMGATQ